MKHRCRDATVKKYMKADSLKIVMVPIFGALKEYSLLMFFWKVIELVCSIVPFCLQI